MSRDSVLEEDRQRKRQRQGQKKKIENEVEREREKERDGLRKNTTLLCLTNTRMFYYKRKVQVRNLEKRIFR